MDYTNIKKQLSIDYDVVFSLKQEVIISYSDCGGKYKKFFSQIDVQLLIFCSTIV